MSRVLELPRKGLLLVCTDLQGCLRDYNAMVDIFHKTQEETDGNAYLLFTGDLVHGPHIDEDEWPEFLGEYYRDQSEEVMRAYDALSREYRGHVFALLGNHEHGHVGGPHTAKFAMDEVALLETRMGPGGAAWLRELLYPLPLVATTRCGAVFTHGAPAARIKSAKDIETAKLDAAEWGNPMDILDVPVVGPILWARSAEPEVARAFAKALGGKFTIFGHDVVASGYEKIGAEQMVVSTSFGVYDHAKAYVRLDLAARYKSVRDLEIGREILPLYPHKAGPERGGTGPRKPTKR